MSIGRTDESVKYKSASAIKSDDREWYRDTLWFELVEAKVKKRERYKPDVDAMIAAMPEDVRGSWAEGSAASDVGLAVVAALDALSEYGGTDDGIRRRVPGGGKFVARLLELCGVRPELSDATRETYAKRFLAHAVNAKKLALARQCKRHSGNADDPRANEYLTYFGREYVENEPSAEPRCMRKRKPAEQLPEPRHEPATEAEEWARVNAELQEEVRTANDHWQHREPTEAARQHKADDAAQCAQVKFDAHGEKYRAKIGDERRATSTPGTLTTARIEAQKSEPHRPNGTDLLREIALGRLTSDAARRRGFVTL